MIQDLTASLKVLLEKSPELRAAQIGFERPQDSYTPNTDTINLFLYDVRESVELRSNEPIVDREGGRYTIKRPPSRLECSYLLTAWVDTGDGGDVAILGQQRLLSSALKVFLGNPVLPDDDRRGALRDSDFPVWLVSARGELVRDPAEFWAAIGGKLRPSITVTATIAIDTERTVDAGPLASTAVMRMRTTMDAQTFEPPVHVIGGVIRSESDEALLAAVSVSIPQLGVRTTSDIEGRFSVPSLSAGTYLLEVSKPGFATQQLSVQVPGATPGCFDISLSPAS